jgi:hypothetical protein
MSDQPQAFLDAPADAMHLFLAGLRERHGSVEEYVTSFGVSGDVLDAVRENLLTLA